MTGETKATKGKTAIPKPFELTDAMLSWAKLNTPGIDPHASTTEMIDYALGRDWRMADWTAVWRNWMKKAHKAANRQSPMAGAPSARAPSERATFQAAPDKETCGYQASAKLLALNVLLKVGGIPPAAEPAFTAKVRQLGNRFAEIGRDTPAEEQHEIIAAARQWLTDLCHKAQRLAGWPARAPGDRPARDPGPPELRGPGDPGLAGSDGDGIPWASAAGVGA
jgi:hypothetical protein